MAPKVATPPMRSPRKGCHVLNAGISQHALEIGLTENEHGGHRHRDQPEKHQQVGAEDAQSGGAEQRVRAEDREKGTIQQRPESSAETTEGGLAVGVGQPRVQRRQSHFRSITDQEEEKRRLEPKLIQVPRVSHEVVNRQPDRRPAGRRVCHGTATKKLPK